MPRKPREESGGQQGKYDSIRAYNESTIGLRIDREIGNRLRAALKGTGIAQKEVIEALLQKLLDDPSGLEPILKEQLGVPRSRRLVESILGK